jgi:hypothetical protein
VSPLLRSMFAEAGALMIWLPPILNQYRLLLEPWPDQRGHSTDGGSSFGPSGRHRCSRSSRPRPQAVISLRRMSWIRVSHSPSCCAEEFSFSRLVRFGHFGLSNGCEERAPLVWKSRARLYHLARSHAEASVLRRLIRSWKVRAAQSKAVSIGVVPHLRGVLLSTQAEERPILRSA